MKCPHCGTPERARVKVCPSCGEAYASQDLLEESQLAFLLEETARWNVPETLRAPYVERLDALRARLARGEPVPPEPAADVTAVPLPGSVSPEAAGGAIPLPPSRPQAPPKAKVPFDRWLLSERNIRIALYAGGLLLVLAGAIFVGVRWAYIPGLLKFAITLLVTGLMALGGTLLFRRPAYRLGGIALLGVACGFLALDFAVLQIYVLGPRGLSNDVMWLIASPLCLLTYLLIARWTQNELFTYLSLAGLGSTLAAALAVLDARTLVFFPAYAFLLLALLVLAKALQKTSWTDLTCLPLLIVSHVGMPVVIVFAAMGWLSETGCTDCLAGSPWWALAAMGVGALFYATANVLYGRLVARWVAAVLLPVALAFALVELGLSGTASGVTLMVLALAYVGVGYALEQREARRAGAWPLYAAAYLLAIYVTALSFSETRDLILALLGDVALLALSAAIFRNRWWLYGAAWLFTLPVYLTVGLYVPAFPVRGVWMGALCLGYAAAGYLLGRDEVRAGALPRRGGPFLTAVVALSLTVMGLAWENPVVVTPLLGAVAALYLFEALWLGRPVLLLPALYAVGLGMLTAQDVLVDYSMLDVLAAAGGPSASVRPERAYVSLDLAYAALAVLLLLVGLWLRRRGRKRWAWPLYLTGALVLAGAYLAGLLVGWGYKMEWLAIGLSALCAPLSLAYAWLERAAFGDQRLPPLLAYLGVAALFAGHFYVIGLVAGSRAGDVWPAYTAGLCGLYVAVAWFLRGEPWGGLYAAPSRLVGLCLALVPMVGSAFSSEPLVGAVTFFLVGVTYLVDAVLRRILLLGYLSVGAFAIAVCALLRVADLSEPQAYVFPFGLALLGIGWNERRRKGGVSYWLPTLLGLGLLMGSAFVQSLPRHAVGHAILLGVESLIALGWGIRTRTRGYVIVGGLALIANAIAQFGPAFVELPRWIQLGVTGLVLLGGGLGALFKREEILQARRRLTEEWKQWEP